MVIHTTPNGTTYFVKTPLYNMWKKNSLAEMKRRNSDRLYIVDGRERMGKSLFTFQQAAVLDDKMFSSPQEFISRICFTPEEFLEAVKNTYNGVVVFDEAFRGFSSRAALSKVNRKLIQATMEMGQNNNIVFIVLPSFFILDWYIALQRSNGLFNIREEKKTGKRYFSLYNIKDKNVIYQEGVRKGWAYTRNSPFKGYYPKTFPGGVEFERAYLEKKRRSFQELEKLEEKPEKETDRQKKIKLLTYHSYLKFKELADWTLADYHRWYCDGIETVTIETLKRRILDTKGSPPLLKSS